MSVEKIYRAHEITRQFGVRMLLYQTRRYVCNRIIQQVYLTEDQLVRRDELKTISDCVISSGEAETVEFSLPDCEDDLPGSVTQLVQLDAIQMEQPFVCEVPNAVLIGQDAVAISEDGAFILEEMLRNDRLLGASLVDTIFDRPKYAFSHLINRETTNSINCAASLINLSGYYHWFMDFLSRIQGIRAYEEETGLHPKILIRPDPPEWMKTSLRLMGYLDQAIQWDNRTTRVNQLIIPTIPREMGPSMNTIHSPSHIEGMRNRILESADPPDQSDFSKYVYISREDTNNRRVINKRELFTALPDSFESYCLSELSLRDQICLFSTAEAVVAPHGAGLVNLLWGSDMDIVELHGVLDNSYFFQLAQNLGHSYASVQCEQDARDLVVDTDALKRRVDCLLSG